MGFSYIGAAAAGTSNDGTTLDTTTSLNVAAHDVLVAIGGWDDHDVTCTIADTVGGNSFALEDRVVNTTGQTPPNGVYSTIGIVTDATANATSTFRLTNSAAAYYRNIIVLQFRPDAGETVTKDQTTAAIGNSTSPDSGDVTTTGTDEITVGLMKSWSSTARSNEQLFGVAATGHTDVGDSTVSYAIQTGTVGPGAATFTAGNSLWNCHIMCLKSEAGGGATTTELTPTVGSGILTGIAGKMSLGITPPTEVS